MFVLCIASFLTKLYGVRFIIDPGHGGADTGATWTRTVQRQVQGKWRWVRRTFREATYNQLLAQELQGALRNLGAETDLTVKSKLCTLYNPCQPRDACYAVDSRQRAFPGAHGCSLRTEGWNCHKMPTVFLSLHSDQFAGDRFARGAMLYHGLYSEETPFMHCLASALRRCKLGRRVSNRAVTTIVSKEDLYLFNNCNARVMPEKMLLEVGCPRFSDYDHWLITTKQGRALIIHAIVEATLDWRRHYQPR